jgi:CubicO group peptidase (beta-lactamase class C family)
MLAIKEINQKAKESAFSGVISIIQGETELVHEAFGWADIANARENKTTTKFGIASGTKAFTALGIGALIAQGKLKLDTKIHDIFQQDLPWIHSEATVVQLLNHTSGIFDYYDEELITDFDNFFVNIPWYALETPTDYLPLFADEKAKFAPGERFSYSNGGYICLGIIIEKVTGQLYRDFIAQHVFAPAQMADSGFYAFNALPENTAYGYKFEENGRFQTNIYNLPARGASDGGAYTTTYDMHKFWQALLTNQILPQELTNLFTTPQTKLNESVDYGYGFYLSQINGKKMIFLVGEDAGASFRSRCVPEKELVITILSNKSDGEDVIREAMANFLKAAT